MLPAIWHRNIFLFGLIGLAAGMLFGTVPTSIPQIILAANWLLEKDFSYKWQQLKSNSIFWVLLSLFALHLIGMCYTDNIQKGLDDLRNKMPLFVLPLILFSTKPLTTKEFKLLFGFFFFSVFVSSICCYLVYAGYTKKIIIDVRKASVFMSHIRFSLFIAFSIIGLIYVAIKEKLFLVKAISVLFIVWLLFFMYKLEMATGFLCLATTAMLLFIVYCFKWFSKKVSVGVLVLLSCFMTFILWKAYVSIDMYQPDKSHQQNVLLEKTKSGRLYYHDTTYGIAENGNLISININPTEIEQEWNKRSHIKFNNFDNKGNEIRFTLLRYLSSKGFPKDSVAISNLTEEDIKHIENGFSNCNYNVNSGLISKWREILWEYSRYKKGENPSGHSISMRLEFWKTAIYIIKQKPLFGEGTGDIQDSFNAAYIKTNSKLDQIWRLRSHNQYLAIGVAFGLFGLLLFLFYLLYPAFILKHKLHYLYWPFFIIVLLSFVTEDTLETQSGVTFFIFFQTLFLWLASHRDANQITEN